jgi:hypothetical protein
MRVKLNLAGSDIEVLVHGRDVSLLVNGIEVQFTTLRLPCGQIVHSDEIYLICWNKLQTN